MRFTIASVIMALQLASASSLPRSDAVDYSALEGVEPFNTTFAEAHLVEGPVLDINAISSDGLYTRASGNVYVCINADWQPQCWIRNMPNDKCGKSLQIGGGLNCSHRVKDKTPQ